MVRAVFATIFCNMNTPSVPGAGDGGDGEFAADRAMLVSLFAQEATGQKLFLSRTLPHMWKIARSIFSKDAKEDLVQAAYVHLFQDDFYVLKCWSGSPTPVKKKGADKNQKAKDVVAVEPGAGKEAIPEKHASLSTYFHAVVYRYLCRIAAPKAANVPEDDLEFDTVNIDPGFDWSVLEGISEEDSVRAEKDRILSFEALVRKLKCVRPHLTPKEGELLDLMLARCSAKQTQEKMGYKNVDTVYKSRSELCVTIREISSRLCAEKGQI
jgi:hypothetical protein